MKKSIQKKIRTTYRWSRLRKDYRDQQPYCEDPFRIHRNELATAQAVHHILPIETEPLLAFQTDNLAALCNDCHQKIEELIRKGKQTWHLFRPSKKRKNG